MFKAFIAQFKDYRLVIKYIISGCIAAASQLIMLFFLVEYLNLWYVLAVIYAFLFSALIAFCLQKFWTFNDRSMQMIHFQAILYTILVLISLSLNVLLMYVFVDIFNLWYIFAQIVTIGLVVMVTFLCNKNIIFKKNEKLPFYFLKTFKEKFKTLDYFNFFRQHKIEFAIFFLAVLVRLIFFFVSLYGNGWDVITTIQGQDGYFQLSKNLLNGNGFSVNSAPPFLPYAYGVPGYPFFLFVIVWLTGSYLTASMVQLLLGATIPVIGMHIARLLLPSFTRAPLAVGVLLALSPYQILFSFIFYTEALFSVVFGIFLLLFLKFLRTTTTRLIIFSGLFLGLATLIKPTVQYLVIISAVFILWRLRDGLRKNMVVKLGYFLLIFFIVLSPWLYRNYQTFNILNLSAQMPFNLYGVLLPSVLAIANNSTFAMEQKKLPILLDNGLSEMNSLSKLAIAEISQHPISLVKLSVLNSVTFFTHDGMLTFLQSLQIFPTSYLQKPALVMLMNSPISFVKMMSEYMQTSMIFVVFARLFWIVATIFFGLGLYQLFRKNLFSTELLFATTIVFYFMLTTMIIGLAVNARFRMPVEPIIFSIFYAGLVMAHRSVKKRFY